MTVETISENAQLYFLVFVRVLALIEIAPLLSSQGVPQIAKIGLAFFATIAVYPWIKEAGYPIPPNGLHYGALVVGEALIGIVIGFFLQAIYIIFSAAGQFFTLQMGLSASEVFDPLAQVEIPIMGQFFNIMAMFIFIAVGGFQKVFLIGVFRSFEAAKALDFVVGREHIFKLLFGSLGRLFEQAMVISFPVLGTLLLVSVSMGLLAKAAPQMNLLMLGFPISISVGFLVLFFAMPFIMEAFARVIDMSFTELMALFGKIAPKGVSP